MPGRPCSLVTLTLIVLVSGSGCAPSAQVASHGPQTQEPQVTLALVNGTLIAGTGAQPIRGAVVLIARDRIVAVGPADRLQVPAGAATIDVGGATILPGFINAHVHEAFDEANLKAWAQGGVTTVRDEGAPVAQIAKLKAFQAQISQDPHDARLVSSGTMMAVPGGYGSLVVSSPEEARLAVLDEFDDGVDAIKVALEDGYAGAHDLPKLTPEELKAIVETAHAHGLPVSAHITQGAYLQPMLDAGVDDIAHLPYDSVAPGSLRQMVDRGVYMTPTFTVLRNYDAPLNGCLDNLKQIVELGGKIALGNDYGGGPGDFELGIPMYEIQMMSQAGMTPMQIIEASTKNAAHVINMEKDLGTLEPGKIADVLVVDGDPLNDLLALTDVKLVIHDGVVIRDQLRD
jgi:imidazolonepropionase-like amidohydrolase